MVSTIIANTTVYQNFNVGSTRSVVVTNALHQLQLTSKIVATVPKDGTKCRLFYADLIKFQNLSA
jgi:hypothetical protein